MMQAFFKAIYEKWPVIRTLAVREVQQQYVGSALGVFWQLITPFTLIAVFWVVFSVGFRVQPNAGVPFVIWLTAGMAAWFVFAEIVSTSVNSLTNNAHLIKKVVFPIQSIVIIKVLAAIFNHAIFLAILLVLIGFSSVQFSLYFLQAMYYFFCMVVFAVGIGWMTSALNVLSRDMARGVGVFLQIGMWATPVLWSIDILPEPYRTVFTLNPMHYVVQGYRDSFLYQIPVTDRLLDTFIFWVVCLPLFFLGVFVFKRLKPQFADLV